ncbi:MAG: Rieske 2Fe-2S domain-containing protein [Candidatus Omnitrophica bacterium]|nr:Rieske 2Fe-2S domain-containing protein [Candidatus Omnitrophota bacterium]
MLIKGIDASEIAPGGMKKVTVDGKPVVICNYEGIFYAVEQRCSHLGASLEMGTLDGYILTCPLHYAQFDIRTGRTLSGPVPVDPQHPTADLVSFKVELADAAGQ